MQRGTEVVDVDARPSDAIAVAVSFDPPLPILVHEDILEQYSG
jgi:bifunctional DNase/RNase